MDNFLILPLLGVIGLLIAMPFIALARADRMLRKLREIEARLWRLEEAAGAISERTAVAPAPAGEMSSPAGQPERTPHDTGAGAAPTAVREERPRADAPTSATTHAPVRHDPIRPAAAPPTSIRPAAAAPERRDMEQIVGGIWLQNAGSVLVLVGVFFLILWGWSTGRFGPGVLVTAGVLLGLGIAWRGDRTRRTTLNIGHALIGIGLGILYLALYLGHFTLHVLSDPVAFVALIAASALTVAAGLHYRVQGIAALGVIGAFLPQALAHLVSLQGFSLPPGVLLAYLAIVDALVFALSARAGWSGLALAAVMLSVGTWIGNVPGGEWSWPLEVGLSIVFVSLGLAPLPRLSRLEGEVRPIDLALVAVTPLALIACSWPMWAAARPEHVAILLLTLAALYLGAGLWVDVHRPERDLWRPLTGAAIVFLTAALQRAVGLENTPLAWTTEGALLVTLGLAPRAGWIRLFGYVVLALGGVWLMLHLAYPPPEQTHPWPILNPSGLRDAVSIAAILFAGLRLQAARKHLAPNETAMSNLWTGLANFMVMLWIHREVSNLSWSLEGNGGRWRRMPDPEAAPGTLREPQLSAATTSLAWFTQSAILIRASLPTLDERRWPFLRYCGYVVGVIALFLLVIGMLMPDGWARDLLPIVHREGLLFLAGALALSAIVVGLAKERGKLAPWEYRVPEMLAAGAALAIMIWIAREADHMARVVLGVPGANSSAWRGEAGAAGSRLGSLAPTLTSVGWLVQALVTLAIGWRRRSAFLRWMGLGLVGLTAIKILMVDLANADPFWRFLTAIAAGVAMLAVSYVYQLRKRRENSHAGPS